MKITGVRTSIYEYETARPLADANFPEGRKRWSAAAVFVDTDDGITGVSIGSPGAVPMIRTLEGLLIGQDPRGVRGLWKLMVDFLFKGGNRGTESSALSALDLALWDLKAKINGEPLWRTLGASNPRVKAYASDIGLCLSDDELRVFYRGMAARGVSAGKLKVGLDVDRDMERLAIMRDELGKAAKRPLLCIDSNEYWSPKTAIRIIREMEREFDLCWVEEPARRWDAAGLKKVSDAVTAAVATGENLKEIYEFLPLFEERAVDVVEVGQGASGVTGAIQIADTAYGFHIPVSIMNCPGNYMAHVAAALPNHMMMEVVDAGREVCFSVDTRLENGEIVVGDAPGFGIVFDEERLAALAPGTAPKLTFVMPGRREGAGLYIVPPK